MIEVQLLNYIFQFRQLTWREKFALKFGKEDPQKIILAAALDNVSGTKTTFEEAMRIFQKIPPAVLRRAYIIYRYKLPKARIFSTRDLYKAPEPLTFNRRAVETEQQREDAVDVVRRQMETTFGRQEVAEQAAVEAEILKKSEHRGAIPKDPNDNPLGGWKEGKK